MLKTPIKLKGSSFTLSVVHLHNEKPEVIHQFLKEKVDQAPMFLEHAPVVINVSHLDTSVNWKNLQRAITAAGLRIVGVSGCNNAVLKDEINHAGLAILSEGKDKNAYLVSNEIKTPLFPKQAVKPIVKTRCIDVPVRSGQRIYAKNCDLIVTSYVSAGAELIADGNIHIYGMMHGRVLAGASGDQNTQIFCTHLTAQLVSIAGIYWLSNEIPAQFYGKAVRFHLKDNTLSAQPLK